jgi:hypothetical protein
VGGWLGLGEFYTSPICMHLIEARISSISRSGYSLRICSIVSSGSQRLNWRARGARSDERREYYDIMIPCPAAAVISVSIFPGAIQFTVTPSFPNSRAIAVVNVTSAALEHV